MNWFIKAILQGIVAALLVGPIIWHLACRIKKLENKEK